MMKVLYVLKLCKTAAIRADEHERIGKEADSAGLIKGKLARINKRLVLVVQKCVVNALLW
jgi:hypothetical protein